MDVKYCNQSGITVAFWVSFREANTTQGLIEFGSGDCGLILARTSDNEMNATIRSMELGITWSLQSVNASIRHGMWHHLALTWNATGEFHLFINGTRYKNIFSLNVIKYYSRWKCGGLTFSSPGSSVSLSLQSLGLEEQVALRTHDLIG